MKIAEHLRLGSVATKPAVMVLRDIQFKARSSGLAAGGPGSGPRPGFSGRPLLSGKLDNLNDKELMLHHAMLERAGEPNAHTAAEIHNRQDRGSQQLSPEQWSKFQSVMKTTHGIRLGNVPGYKDAGGDIARPFKVPESKRPTNEGLKPTFADPAELAKIRSRPSRFSGIEAGGPGSGRHPGGGRYNTTKASEHPFHQTLIDHGFRHSGSAKNTHFYVGNPALRTPAATGSGKLTQWTSGHGFVLGTARGGKPNWADAQNSHYQGDSAAGLRIHLKDRGWGDEPTHIDEDIQHSIEAGGPGSGRHKGIDNLLRKTGFKHDGSWSSPLSKHRNSGFRVHNYSSKRPDLYGDHRVNVDTNGGWSHQQLPGGKEHFGSGRDSLLSHLTRLGIAGS